MSIEIRPLQTNEEYRAAEDLQREVWGLNDIRITPDHVLITAQKNGGLVLGAFDMAAGSRQPVLVGYVYGFVGLRTDGRLKHCSHQLGVLPNYQDQHIGYRLKLAQRDMVLKQGIDLITWTFDPLESRNASLNLRKLGAVCHTYIRNMYGNMRDALNRGLPSDRFEVEWYIASQHVARRLQQHYRSTTLAALQAKHVPLLNPSPPGTLPREQPATLPLERSRLLVQIPCHFQATKAHDIDLALAWRQQTGFLLEGSFAAGYTAVDVIFEDEQCYYLLEKDWTLV